MQKPSQLVSSNQFISDVSSCHKVIFANLFTAHCQQTVETKNLIVLLRLYIYFRATFIPHARSRCALTVFNFRNGSM